MIYPGRFATRRSAYRNSPLWVVTSYFNPLGYQRRLSNYRVFRRELVAPLLTVEMSTGRDFALDDTDADILVQCPKGEVMWQKERLLNHALAHLPPACRYVAWVDNDLLVGADDWPEQVQALLQQVPVVQMFDISYHTPPEAQLESFQTSPDWMMRPSVAFRMSQGDSFNECSSRFMLPTDGQATPGLAWAARRTLLETHGWYDANIIGGGDNALASAAMGKFDLIPPKHYMSPRRSEHYRAWAEAFYNDVRGEIAYVPAPVTHLWHGDPTSRRYLERHQDMVRFDFDPTRDIAISKSGPWRWASDKPELHSYLRDYFVSRQEDGCPVAAV